MALSRSKPQKFTVPQGASGYGAADNAKELGWELLSVLDYTVEWDVGAMTSSAFDRHVNALPNVIRGVSAAPAPFYNALGAARSIGPSMVDAEYDAARVIEVVGKIDSYIKELAALTYAGMANPQLYKKGYKPRKNPAYHQKEVLNAFFLAVQAYRMSVAGLVSDWTDLSEKDLQERAIAPAEAALAAAANTAGGSFLKHDTHFLATYFENLTDFASGGTQTQREDFLANAKETLGEIIGAGFYSPFFEDELASSITLSTQGPR